MSQTLISFLGRVPKTENGYRPTTYTFNSEPDEPTAFIGWTLHRRLKPDRLVILGTTGSMWDHLFEKDFVLGEEAENERLLLQEATEKKEVTTTLLKSLTPLLEKRLRCEIQLLIIPYCRTENEQLELLRIMAAAVNTGDLVHLDVTHGFRHLPMIALLSALHLRKVRNADIRGIWYGAFDPDTGEAPIHDLAGLLRIASWVSALSTFDKDGDYSVFADRLDEDGLTVEGTNHLRRAAFFERTSNPRDARNELTNFNETLTRGLPGVSALFAEQLQERLKWHHRDNLFANQVDLANFYRKRGDYIRAAIFACEAFITRLIDHEAGEKEDNYKTRKAALSAYTSKKRRQEWQHLCSSYCLLRDLRNTLAHGNEPSNPNISGIIADEKRLNQEMERLIRVLLDNRE
ncbi:MAG: TIGR02221 family CRISPR-associated protein [Candidatus Competibacteraceae bacterium]|nr:TIGR02221 family CRISPR-associated protein [Candidatus Competibacteraceae bacterium]